ARRRCPAAPCPVARRADASRATARGRRNPSALRPPRTPTARAAIARRAGCRRDPRREESWGLTSRSDRRSVIDAPPARPRLAGFAVAVRGDGTVIPRQPDDERRTVANVARRAQLSGHAGRELAADGQSQPRSTEAIDHRRAEL